MLLVYLLTISDVINGTMEVWYYYWLLIFHDLIGWNVKWCIVFYINFIFYSFWNMLLETVV